jgi:hypothetical protein
MSLGAWINRDPPTKRARKHHRARDQAQTGDARRHQAQSSFALKRRRIGGHAPPSARSVNDQLRGAVSQLKRAP